MHFVPGASGNLPPKPPSAEDEVSHGVHPLDGVPVPVVRPSQGWAAGHNSQTSFPPSAPPHWGTESCHPAAAPPKLVCGGQPRLQQFDLHTFPPPQQPVFLRACVPFLGTCVHAGTRIGGSKCVGMVREGVEGLPVLMQMKLSKEITALHFTGGLWIDHWQRKTCVLSAPLLNP